MSIIDQARAEADLTLTGDSGGPWAPDVAFVDGVQWLLDQLTDPDPETVEAFAIAMFEGRGNRLKWDRHADDPTQEHWRRIARDAITALTNHLTGRRRRERAVRLGSHGDRTSVCTGRGAGVLGLVACRPRSGGPRAVRAGDRGGSAELRGRRIPRLRHDLRPHHPRRRPR